MKEGEKIVLLEGRKQTKYENGFYEGILLYKDKGEIVQQKIELSLDEYHSTENAIAIDNDFLMLKP